MIFQACDSNNSRLSEGSDIKKPPVNISRIKAVSKENNDSVIVTGVTADLVDTLDLLFESESKSGGGKLRGIELDLDHSLALITFESPSGKSYINFFIK